MALQDIGIGRRASTRERGRRRRVGHLEPVRAPFDAPFEDGFAGIRYVGGGLVTTLAVPPGSPRPHRLGSSWFAPATSPGAGLPLDSLLQLLRRPDAAATAITVRIRGGGCPGDGPAPTAYRGLLGPLPAAGRRSIRLTVRTDPLLHPGLTARYGAGPTAALRASLAATRRVAALLRGCGVSAVPLTAAQVTATELAAAGASAPGSAGYDDAATGTRRYSVSATDGETLCTAMESVWNLAEGPVECTLELRPGDDGPAVCASVGVTGSLCGSPPVHWTPLTGEVPALALPAVRDLAGARLPIDDDGVIVGADPDGRPVGLRLAGPDIARADVVGRLDLVRRIVVRLVAAGHSTAVFTERPERWAGLLDAVADRGMLHAAADGRAQVLLDDRPGARLGPLDGHTILRVHDDADPGFDPGHHPLVRQDSGDPAVAEVSGGGRRIRVRLVATPAEDALVRG